MALVCDHKSEPSEVEPNEVNLEDGEIEDGEIEDDDEVVPEQSTVENAAPTTGSAPKIDEKVDRDRPRDRSREHRDKRHKDKEPRHMTEAEKSILHLRRKERMEREREKWNRRKEHQNVEPQDDFAKKLEITLASILKKDRNTSDDDKDEERRGVKRKKKDKDNEYNAKHHKSDSQSEVDEKEMLNVRGGSPEQMYHDGDDKVPSEGSKLDSDEMQKRQEAAKRRKRIKKKEKAKMKKQEEKASKDNKNNHKEVKVADPAVNSKGICIFYLNGKCNKNDCVYSHEAVPPMKLELCKFYLSDCCAKGDNCFYMHSDFPCKFYHLGLPCKVDKCKFAHGEPLSDGLKQILFKHIETAPRDILGGFPRLSREETLQMMDNTQKSLSDMYKERSSSDNEDSKGGFKEENPLPSLLNINVPVPSELNDMKIKLSDKAGRNKPSRWQAPEPKEKMASGPVNFSPFNFSKDQDMRITSNGDVDMRTLPPHPLSSLPQPLPSSLMSSDLSRMNSNPVRNATGDVDIRNMPPNFASDIDIRLQSSFEAPPAAQQDQSLSFLGSKDVDIRQFGAPPPSTPMDDGRGSQNVKNDSDLNLPPNMPKMQRDLYLRIHSQQKENPPVYNDYDHNRDDDGNDEDWYSDDDEEHRLIIKVDNEENEATEQKEEKTETVKFPCLPAITPLPVQPQEVVEKLGDLSKIKITADITKLLSSINSLPNVKTPETPRDPRQLHKGQGGISSPSRSPTSSNIGSPAPLAPRTLFDPRLSTQDPKVNQASEAPRDPRRANSVAGKMEKMSIYEQGGLNMEEGEASEEYKASSRPDVDLRTMGLKFKGVESYTPAKEIDASFSTHLPIPWKVIKVDVPRPDYSGLKLSLEEAEKNGDPRLRKIFRLSVDEERDTPLSPLASPQRPTGVRLDPRLRKAEEAKSTNPNVDSSSMNYTQQLNTLQSSAFYQSLTTNQKLMLNQELASRSDQTGSHDPILNNILASLNLLPSISGGGAPPMHPQGHGHNFGVANNILQNISKMNHMGGANMMNPNAMLGQMTQGGMQPGLLGAAPGIPNMPQQDFPMNFDPRAQNGLLGNRPPQQFPNFEPPPNQGGGFQNYPNDDYYPQEPNQGGFRGNQGRNDRGGGNFNPRERRRGVRNNNFGRNPPNRNQFKNRNQGGNRSNKNHNQS